MTFEISEPSCSVEVNCLSEMLRNGTEFLVAITLMQDRDGMTLSVEDCRSYLTRKQFSVVINFRRSRGMDNSEFLAEYLKKYFDIPDGYDVVDINEEGNPIDSNGMELGVRVKWGVSLGDERRNLVPLYLRGGKTPSELIEGVLCGKWGRGGK